MTAVYDWVGSLSLMPEHFRLCLFDGKCLLPSEPVQVAQRTMLYMSECENIPNLLEEDDEINFHGFGDTCDQVTLDDTLALRSLTSEPLASFVLLPVPDSPPEQLQQGDDTG